MDSIVQWTLDFFLPLGNLGLFLVSFAESSFFPIPPEALLLPLSLAKPSNALLYGTVVTLASVFGGVAGYYLGIKGGRPLLLKITSAQKVAQVERLFRKYDAWAIGIAALTPIPYKVFTITSGIFAINLRKFVIASLIGRGARFLTEGLLIYLYGPQIVNFLKHNFEWITIAIALLVILFFVLTNHTWNNHRPNR